MALSLPPLRAPEFPFWKGFQQLTRFALPTRFNLGQEEKCHFPRNPSLIIYHILNIIFPPKYKANFLKEIGKRVRVAINFFLLCYSLFTFSCKFINFEIGSVFFFIPSHRFKKRNLILINFIKFLHKMYMTKCFSFWRKKDIKRY